jgi:hypothetical protein
MTSPLTDTHTLPHTRLLSGISKAGSLVFQIQTRDGVRKVEFRRIPREIAQDRNRIKLLRERIDQLAAISSQVAVKAHSIEVSQGELVLIYDFVESCDVLTFKRTIGAIPVDALLFIGAEVASALCPPDTCGSRTVDMGSGLEDEPIIHGAIKAQCIRITPQGEVKILGWYDIEIEEPWSTDVGATQFSPYESSNSATVSSQIRHPCDDVYALGAILIELLTGTTMNVNESLERIQSRGGKVSPSAYMWARRTDIHNQLHRIPDLPIVVRSLLMRAISSDRSERPNIVEFEAVIRSHTSVFSLMPLITVNPPNSSIGRFTRLGSRVQALIHSIYSSSGAGIPTFMRNLRALHCSIREFCRGFFRSGSSVAALALLCLAFILVLLLFGYFRPAQTTPSIPSDIMGTMNPRTDSSQLPMLSPGQSLYGLSSESILECLTDSDPATAPNKLTSDDLSQQEAINVNGQSGFVGDGFIEPQISPERASADPGGGGNQISSSKGSSTPDAQEQSGSSAAYVTLADSRDGVDWLRLQGKDNFKRLVTNVQIIDFPPGTYAIYLEVEPGSGRLVRNSLILHLEAGNLVEISCSRVDLSCSSEATPLR